MITVDMTKDSVHEFAGAVRAALADLPADEVDELTDGLEADLAERAIELGGTEGFGDPVAYADELRVSAGLPERGIASKKRRISARALWSTGRTDAARRIRQVPAGAWLLDLLVALRPVWWLARGWAVYQLVVAVMLGQSLGVFPTTRVLPGSRWLVAVLLLVAFELLSIQWGRGRWLPWRWLHGVRIIASVVAAITVLPLIPISLNTQLAASGYDSAESVQPVPQGLVRNGQEVDNIFAFDADGKPLTDVRLYDQNGDPLLTVPDASQTIQHVYTNDGEEYTLAPSVRADGSSAWAVYPLRKERGGLAPAPFGQVQPLAAAPTSTTQPMQTPSPGGSTPGPSPDDAPAQTPAPTPAPTN